MRAAAGLRRGDGLRLRRGRSFLGSRLSLLDRLGCRLGQSGRNGLGRSRSAGQPGELRFDPGEARFDPGETQPRIHRHDDGDDGKNRNGKQDGDERCDHLRS